MKKLVHKIKDTLNSIFSSSKGFTLLELLVVVLIIGILATIALPQYKRSVWRSRNIQLKTVAKAVAGAEERYYLSNGRYTGNFNELDLYFPFSIGAKTCTAYTTTGVSNSLKGNNFEILITTANLQTEANITAVWTEGPYKCDGFFLSSASGQLYCRESYYGNKNFCIPIENGTIYPSGPKVLIYSLP